MKKKVTRREQFLADMDAVVPWIRLQALIEPHYPKAGLKDGRPPMPLETMLRIYFLQNWYALSDPMAEETLYDSEAMRRFAGIELGDDRIPDETTILNFRHLLERHGLTEAIFADVNAHLADKGITLRSGTLVDATIIDAPSSTKNQAKARDPEMSLTKKGNDWYFGMKAHVGVDVDSGSVHSLEATTAKVNDSRVWDELLHVEETSVWADKGYISAEREAAFSKEGKVWGVMRKASKGGKLDTIDDRDQPDHRKGACKSRASLPRYQATVRSYEDPLSGAGQEPGASVHAVRARQPVPRSTTADGMTMSPSEIGISAAQAGKTVQKLLKTGRQKARTTLMPAHPRSRRRRSDVPKHLITVNMCTKSL